MAMYDYSGALRLGRKKYQEAISKGEYPYLPVLDEILANTEIVSEVSLGVMDVPLERIVGTKTQGRTQAFASNFMPLLGEKTEFGAKWAALYDYQITEGIQDPILAYEFMNRYYVQEGNKRVSVLKYVGAYSISASVIRLIPKRDDNLDTRLYYEFLDFYQVSFNCDLWFSQEGSYDRLLELMGKKPGQVWDEDERKYFKAVYDLFVRVFSSMRTDQLEMTPSDAFLKYVELFGYDTIKQRTESQMKDDLEKIWDELLLASRGGKIALVEQPSKKGSSSGPKFINWLLPDNGIEPEMLNIAFLYTATKDTSSWTYGHELGRIYLEQCFKGKLRTRVVDQLQTPDQELDAIESVIADGCNLIFTAAPQMATASVKAAVRHPEVRIFNCSVNMSYSSICTYYVRTFESKFLMGALAAAMSEKGKLGYIADYPLYGTTADINAFAMGARMINPRVKVWLEWSGLDGDQAKAKLEQEGITYISGDDMITPGHPSREYGLYHKREDGSVENLATPLCHWGKFYEQIVRQICRGSMENEDLKGRKAVNYWWGMSADVVDVVCSQDLPIGTNRLIEFLKSSIRVGAFQPFAGKIRTQGGRWIGSNDSTLTPQEIVSMDWLCDNICGEIPAVERFAPQDQPMVRIHGVRT